MAYKSEETHMLKALRMSRALKEKAGWSREIGAGFIAEDMTEMKLGWARTSISYSAGVSRQ
jgi:hypothetical protein